MLKRLFLMAVVGASLLACKTDKAHQSGLKEMDEKMAFKVAVLPTLEAVPLCYAVETGLADRLGLRLSLKVVDSQFSMSESVKTNVAEVGMLDFVRLAYHRGRGEDLVLVASMMGEAGIVASKSLRIKKIEQMDERTFGVERFSMLDQLRETAQLDAKMPYDRLLIAQINSYPLRTVMLDENQIDGAVLPQPFLRQAQMRGHTLLTQKPMVWKLGFVTKDSSIVKDMDRLKLLVKVYNASVRKLNTTCDSLALLRVENRLKYDRGLLSRSAGFRYKALQSPTIYETASVSAYLERRKGSKRGLSSPPYSTRIMP